MYHQSLLPCVAGIGILGVLVTVGLLMYKDRQKKQKESWENESVYFSVIDAEEEYQDCVDEYGSTDEERELYEEVDRLTEKRDLWGAVVLLEKLKNEDSGFFWRYARWYELMARKEKNVKQKRDYILKGIEYAERALEKDEKNSEAHKYFAILSGMKGQEDSWNLSEKITAGRTFKNHIDKAIKINPKDPHLYHLSGRFKYEVACKKGKIPEFFVKSFAGDDFTFSYDDAIKDFLKAEKFSEFYEHSECYQKENKLFLAKSYEGNRNKEMTIRYLKEAHKLSNTAEDPELEREIRELLSQYS